MRNEPTLYALIDQGDAIYLVHHPDRDSWLPGPIAYANDTVTRSCAEELANALGVPLVVSNVTELLDEHFQGREREAEQAALLEIARKHGPQVFQDPAKGEAR